MGLASSTSTSNTQKRGFFARLMRAPAPRAPSRVPEGVRVYAVGDIHGCADQLNRMLNAVQADASTSASIKHLVFLGDYVDRGPDSRGVIERLSSPFPGFKTHFLRGNHDQAILDFLQDPSFYRTWRSYGAPETLVSYGVVPPRFDKEAEFTVARDKLASALPGRHVRFLENLELSARIGDYFFAHAGVRPGVKLDHQVADDLLWIRDEFLMSNDDFGATVVHGHTPGNTAIHRTNRICIDTGVYATGRLTAAVLEGETCRFLAT
jgi:serine/threonine protein phosphatase 1